MNCIKNEVVKIERRISWPWALLVASYVAFDIDSHGQRHLVLVSVYA